ncbi:hypothetical protein [[Flexibacter] sp. ATCC 35208]|uniref:hypothetical protein n=1 Tax=[Flexibacter] sp. ATCC 35208 TaxID=1936242 RepID=UPI0009D412E3|nr:hypothetical protein [[Flexibacter] sp. ATCC 35208]OMP74907.1 hypothetical protein BW716_32975 [[Flexibacter] sp. ATCC 35208]
MRIILAPDSKKEVIVFINDVNYEITGRQMELDEKSFKSFWESDIVSTFNKKTGKLIDDFETTIIVDDNELSILKEIIEGASFNIFDISLKNELVALAKYANQKKSGIIFIF